MLQLCCAFSSYLASMICWLEHYFASAMFVHLSLLHWHLRLEASNDNFLARFGTTFGSLGPGPVLCLEIQWNSSGHCHRWHELNRLISFPDLNRKFQLVPSHSILPPLHYPV